MWRHIAAQSVLTQEEIPEEGRYKKTDHRWRSKDVLLRKTNTKKNTKKNLPKTPQKCSDFLTNVHVPQELTYDSVDGRVQELQVLLVPPLDTELVKLSARLD